MAPTIHLVRHAQAVHNLTVANHSMPDPPLTPLGEQQCRDLCAKFPYHSSVKLVVTSPLRRTIQTSLIAFESELSRSTECVALPEVQETSDLPCDTGSDIFAIKEDFKDKPVNFSLVPEGWNNKQGKWAANGDAVAARCREVRRWLKMRDEQAIVVVTHGGLLHYLTEDWTGAGKFQGKKKESFIRRTSRNLFPFAYGPRYIGTGWENVEFRSYHFVDGDDENASIRETEESKQQRGYKDKPLTKEEKVQLRETTAKTWEEQGYEKASKV
ncbi:MAG: hypothetical protein L6R41_002783 [Letrouitia leprolyta]|nr:MAG: hypothetical protein L6R41_002783 [Letrouitia leprolyta]